MSDTNERQRMIDSIIELELDMFLAVSNRGGTSVCQERPETFRTMRWTSHSVQSDAFLAAYLHDLKQAGLEGRNLMTEKYALMENLIPDLTTDPCVDELVQIEGDWRDALAERYPHVVRADAGPHFRTYLGCELQTLSPKALALYRETVDKAVREGKNLLLERYENLFRKTGGGTMAEREEAMAKKAQEGPRCPFN